MEWNAQGTSFLSETNLRSFCKIVHFFDGVCPSMESGILSRCSDKFPLTYFRRRLFRLVVKKVVYCFSICVLLEPKVHHSQNVRAALGCVLASLQVNAR